MGEMTLQHVYSGKVRDIYDAGDGQPAVRRVRPHLGLRRRDGRARARQGPGAHGHVGVLARAARRRGAQPPGLDRPGRPPARGVRDRRRGRADDAGAPGRDAAGRVHRARLPHRARRGRSTRRRARCTARRCPRACGSPSSCPSRCSRRRPRPTIGATTRTSPSTRPSTSSARTWPSRRATSRSPLYQRGRGAGPPSAGSSSPTPSSSSASSTASWSLCDEVLTPDSSRFWPADEWEPGSTPPSFDKQPVRDCLDGDSAGTSSRRRRRCRAEVVDATRDALRRGLRAHHRARRFADWYGVADRDATVDGACSSPCSSRCSCGPASPTRRAPPSSGRCPRSASTASTRVRVGKTHPLHHRSARRGRGPRRRSRSCASGSSPTR